jgi:hypothetical protein
MENTLPTTPRPSWKDKFHLPLIFWLTSGVGVIALIAGGLFYLLSPKFYNNLKNKISEGLGDQNISTPYKPTPIPLANGKQVYTISGSLPGAPRISEVTFDPIDPDKGGNFNLAVKTLDGTGVTSVEVTLNTDNKSTDSKLNLTDGTNNDGVWTGSLKMDDSYDYIYRLRIKAKNTGGVIQANTITVR